MSSKHMNGVEWHSHPFPNNCDLPITWISKELVEYNSNLGFTGNQLLWPSVNLPSKYCSHLYLQCKIQIICIFPIYSILGLWLIFVFVFDQGEKISPSLQIITYSKKLKMRTFSLICKKKYYLESTAKLLKKNRDRTGDILINN